MSQQHVAVCSCGSSECCEYESQLVCTECGRTVSEVHLQHFTGDAGGSMEEGWSFVPSSGDGSQLCAPVSHRGPTRLPGLKAKVSYFSNLLTLPQYVLDEATASLDALCSRTFHNDCDGARSAVALFVACRVQRYPMTLRNLCQWMRVGVPEASRCLQRYNRLKSVPCPPIQADELLVRCVHQYAAANNLSSSVTAAVLKLATRLLSFSSRHIAESSSLWHASACILLALALTTHTKPSARVVSSLNLGINQKNILQRHLPALISALRAHAEHSPGVSTPSTPPPLASCSAAQAERAAPPAAAQQPHTTTDSCLASESVEQPRHSPPTDRAPPSIDCRQIDPPLQDHTPGAAGGRPSATHPAATDSAAELALHPSVQLQHSTEPPAHTTATSGDGGAATCVIEGGPCSAAASRGGLKRHAGENACQVVGDATRAKVPRRPGAAGVIRGVLGDVSRGGAEGEVSGGAQGCGDLGKLSLSVVQGVLDVDECLALCS